MKLLFSPISNGPIIISATNEYQTIWNEDGAKIVATMEEISGLSFIQQEISVIIYEGISHSGSAELPMKLRASYPLDIKRGTLIHELGHRLIEQLSNRPDNLDEHRLLFLVLYDIWTDLYGQDFANEMVVAEKLRKGYYNYALVWEQTLILSRSERMAKFESVKKLNKI